MYDSLQNNTTIITTKKTMIMAIEKDIRNDQRQPTTNKQRQHTALSRQSVIHKLDKLMIEPKLAFVLVLGRWWREKRTFSTVPDRP
jgi:hypothetical protein